MTVYLGAGYYRTVSLETTPRVAIRAIELVRTTVAGARVAFYGMLAGSDKYARPKSATTEALKELETDIRGGVFSDLVAYAGKRTDPRASLAVQVSASVADHRSSLTTIILRCEGKGELSSAEDLLVELWTTLEPAYGFVTLGESFASVAAELNCTPIRQWGASPHQEDGRILLLQKLRAQFGPQTRGATWGAFLGRRLVERLGGEAAVRTQAPVYEVRAVPKGLYLRLTERPTVFAGEVAQRAAPLRAFLAPVTPPELV